MFVEKSSARIYGDIAITNGILQFEPIASDETIIPVRALFTCVYQKRKKQWQVLTWQTTKLEK